MGLPCCLIVQNTGSVNPFIHTWPRCSARDTSMPCGRRRGIPALKRVKQNCRRCSHGPVGRLPGVKSSAELNRPQAGGYSICEIALGPQMLREPVGGGIRRAVELVGVSREVTAGVEL